MLLMPISFIQNVQFFLNDKFLCSYSFFGCESSLLGVPVSVVSSILLRPNPDCQSFFKLNTEWAYSDE